MTELNRYVNFSFNVESYSRMILLVITLEEKISSNMVNRIGLLLIFKALHIIVHVHLFVCHKTFAIVWRIGFFDHFLKLNKRHS